jgi:hypothetical protein
VIGLPYETKLGLWLNIDRVREQKAHEVYTGICYALGKGPLPKEYFDGIALVPGDAKELAFETNMRRKVAMEKQKHGFSE